MKYMVLVVFGLSLTGVDATAAEPMCDGEYDQRLEQLSNDSEISDSQKFELASMLHEAHQDCISAHEKQAEEVEKRAMFEEVWDRAFNAADRN
ncbi:MAG: hypothetical protein AAF412_15485 [Pseudomonadota bacterium]